METIRTLDTISFDALFTAFNEAFIDYEVQVNRDELQVMLSRRGFVPSLSFGLFEDSMLVSFTLNGIGEFNGEKTAYDTGTGTIKEYRGRGYASRIFMESLPSLRRAGVTQYLLEVLQHNTKAVSVYRKLGFEEKREFNYFKQSCLMVNIPGKKLSPGYRIAEAVLEQVCDLKRFWDFAPSWQNSFDAIKRRTDDFKIFCSYKGNNIVGYIVFEPGSGDITQLSVDKSHRRRGLASALLFRALGYNRHDSVKAINTEISCTGITAFLESCGIVLRGKQFEMVKKL
ncbi:MAG TPA: GNAT family N-acetyltransferase [Bacteroidales bacterium]|nr:GNAT family N-acetyltransferase [Bacteroidales bacterium]